MHVMPHHNPSKHPIFSYNSKVGVLFCLYSITAICQHCLQYSIHVMLWNVKHFNGLVFFFFLMLWKNPSPLHRHSSLSLTQTLSFYKEKESMTRIWSYHEHKKLDGCRLEIHNLVFFQCLSVLFRPQILILSWKQWNLIWSSAIVAHVLKHKLLLFIFVNKSSGILYQEVNPQTGC